MSAESTTLDLTRPAAHLRELAGLTLAQAAAALGITISAANKPELGERVGKTIRLANLLRRADAYGLTLEIVVRRT